jgi:DNA repair exonuclease SbcCD ATPase subunit/DNA repair exonuclease SbcCD nuclease subunit
MIKKIAHCGYIHLFNSKSFHVHEYVFDQFYKDLDKEKPELIVVAGDIIDSKIRLSPEQVALCQNFFLNITNYAPVIMILGNHDLALQNIERLDSVSSIVYPLYNQTKHPIHFIKQSGIYNLYGINWAVWSCLDNQATPFTEEVIQTYHKHEQPYTIGLYHGAVKGCKAENGMILSEGIDLQEFYLCNVVMMADIHTGEKFRNNEVAYSGSFVQTKVNENPYGSYLIWKWQGQTYKPNTKRLENIYSTVSYKLDDVGLLPQMQIDSATQVININYDPSTVSKVQINELKKELTNKYENKIEIRPLIKKKAKKAEQLQTVVVGEEEEVDVVVNVRDYMRTYMLKNHELVSFDAIFDLDDKYGCDIDVSKDFVAGDFSIQRATINNFLSYPPEDTSFDFSKEGLYSIIADNRAGKSNLITDIKFALFNSVPQVSSLKALINKHNKNKEAFVSLVITKNGMRYKLTRTIIPKKSGVGSDLDVVQIDEQGNELRSLRGEKRQETEKEIQKLFGIENIFDILSFSSAQKRQIEFIDCKNAERLTLVNRFMGLQSFEEKEKMVAADLKNKKAVYTELTKDFNSTLDINLSEKTYKALQEQIEELKSARDAAKIELEKYIKENEKLVKQYNEIRVVAFKKVDSPEEVKSRIETLTERNKNFYKVKEEKEQKIEHYKKQIHEQKVEFLEVTGQDIKSYKPNHKVNTKLEQELAINLAEIKKAEKQLVSDTCNSCGREYSEKDRETCRVLIDKLKETNQTIEKEIAKNEEELEILIEFQSDYNNTGRLISTLQSEVLDYQNKIINTENEIERLQNRKSEYDEVQKAKELFVVLEEAYEQYVEAKEAEEKVLFDKAVWINAKEQDLKTTAKEIKVYYDKFAKLEELEREIELLKTYRSIITKDALPLYILKTKISLINEQINLVVNQVFDYSVEFVVDEDAGDLDIAFAYPDDVEKTESGLASGSETFIMNLCIKVGLAQVSELPKADTLYIDEGFGTLDKTQVDKVPNLFNALNEYYRNVITISHLDELKDMAQHQIRLQKGGKYTQII